MRNLKSKSLVILLNLFGTDLTCYVATGFTFAVDVQGFLNCHQIGLNKSFFSLSLSGESDARPGRWQSRFGKLPLLYGSVLDTMVYSNGDSNCNTKNIQTDSKYFLRVR
jgi:hypothetical protein